MQPVVITVQDPAIEIDRLRKSLHMKPEAPIPGELQQLLQEAHTIALPKALYKLSFIEDRSEDGVSLDGVAFTSRILRVNLDPINRAFPYVATAGLELYEWAGQFTDMMLRFWADAIQEEYLFAARQALVCEIQDRYETGELSRMSPGSLEDWPLSEQPALFRLLEEPAAQIGVRLTESLLMIPVKSVSGILFAAEQGFASCMLCPRENCRGRQVPFDAGLYARKYAAG